MLHESHDQFENSIALIGMSGRFPGANSVDTFWTNLRDKHEALIKFSEEDLHDALFNLDGESIPHALNQIKQKTYVKTGFCIDGLENFDSTLFGYTPSEAELLDPQQRIFLEATWHALENAGYDPFRYTGSIGVFAGSTLSRYFLRNIYSHREIMYSPKDLTVGIGNECDYLTNRVSYKLNLKGPSVTFQTACSTSLVAIHYACQSLLTGECDIALAGGSVAIVPQKLGYLYEEGSLNSPDGHIRAFDAMANGTCFSSAGVGVVVLKRLSDAIADKDSITCIIRGSAVNNDGSFKAGYTAPGIDGQVRVVSEAISVARVHPEEISYIETHGTGTPVGDPIEISALSQVFGRYTKKNGFCSIGTVKPNVGHLAAAAGVASLIKVALSLKNKQLLPTINYHTQNPQINFEQTPFVVNTKFRPWETEGGRARIAGVSSFGIGGTNAHVILQEFSQNVDVRALIEPKVFFFSGQTKDARDRVEKTFTEYIGSSQDLDMSSVSNTLKIGKKLLPYRSAVIAKDASEFRGLLEAKPSGLYFADLATKVDRPLVFMFPGQGSQYCGMGKGLYEKLPLFKEKVDKCSELFMPILKRDIREFLLCSQPDQQLESALQRTSNTQPSLFAIEYALARQIMEWGIKPDCMIGHSVGEYVAACLSGVYALEDCCELVANRGILMESMKPGSMLSVDLAADESLQYTSKDVWLAVSNGPTLSVLSGSTESIRKIEEDLRAKSIGCRILKTSHAFHSGMMDPAIVPLNKLCEKMRIQSMEIPYISNVSGEFARQEELENKIYWGSHLRGTVRFYEGMKTLALVKERCFIEVGPGKILSTLAKSCIGASSSSLIIPLMRSNKDNSTDYQSLQAGIARLFTIGGNADWSKFETTELDRRVPLPVYPFEKIYYWVKPNTKKAFGAEGNMIRSADVSDWFYAPSWQQLPYSPKRAPLAKKEKAYTVVFLSDNAIHDSIVAELENCNHSVIKVYSGASFHSTETEFTICPSDESQYVRVFEDIESQQKLKIGTVLYLWCLDQPKSGQLQEDLDKGLECCFYSLVYLSRAISSAVTGDAISVSIVSNSTSKVLADDSVDPIKATSIGIVLSIPQEYNSIKMKLLDIQLEHSVETVKVICSDLESITDRAIIAYRGGNKWLRSVIQHPVEKAEHVLPELRKGGTYVITGGMGGVGYTIASYFAKQYKANLVLIGRSEMPDEKTVHAIDNLRAWKLNESASEKIDKVKFLRALGSNVEVYSADVSDEVGMKEILSKVVDKYGSINGVIHAAGNAGKGAIHVKGKKQIENVLLPKIYGAFVLEKMLNNSDLDFFITCSSLFSFVGGKGQVDYSAANCFLDAFIQSKSGAGHCRYLSVNWSGWSEVGMAKQNQPEDGNPLSSFSGMDGKHLLLHRRVDIDNNNYQFSTRFTGGRTWLMTDHLIAGNPVVPGTALIEIARQAYQNLTGAELCSFKDITFFSACIVPYGKQKEIVTTVKKQDNGSYSFHCTCDEKGNSVSIIAGEVGPMKNTQNTRIELEKIWRRCNKADRESVYNSGDFLKITGRWSLLKEVFTNQSEALAHLKIDPNYSNDCVDLKLHPAILDMSTGPTAGVLLSLDESLKQNGVGTEFLPYSYGSMEMYRPLSEDMYTYIQKKTSENQEGVIALDILIANKQGDVAVQIKDFMLREIKTGRFTMQNNEPKKNDPVATMGDPGISNAEGIDTFLRSISTGLPQIIVSPIELQMLLPRFIVPKEIVTKTEKNGRDSVAAVSRTSDYVAPVSDTEKVLATIFEKVLGTSPIGTTDNFLQLGTDSVTTIQIVSEARKLGLAIKPDIVFRSQNIVELANVIETNTASSSVSSSEKKMEVAESMMVSDSELNSIMNQIES